MATVRPLGSPWIPLPSLCSSPVLSSMCLQHPHQRLLVGGLFSIPAPHVCRQLEGPGALRHPHPTPPYHMALSQVPRAAGISKPSPKEGLDQCDFPSLSPGPSLGGSRVLSLNVFQEIQDHLPFTPQSFRKGHPFSLGIWGNEKTNLPLLPILVLHGAWLAL